MTLLPASDLREIVDALAKMPEPDIRQCIAALEGRPGDGPEFLCDVLKAALERRQGMTDLERRGRGEYCHPSQMPPDTEGSGSFVDDLAHCGKKAASRLLGGCEYNEFPEADSDA